MDIESNYEEKASLVDPSTHRLNSCSAYRRSIFFTSFLVLLSLVIALSVVVGLMAHDNKSSEASYSGDPNVIFFIADGFSPEAITYIRTMQSSGELPDAILPIDSGLVGMVKTYSADDRITDSAAGATAYACTMKTLNDVVAVLPDQKPCGTLLEAAKRSGRWRTGVVTTTRISHATPAAWTSHVAYRDQEADIALQQATQQSVDVLFGGGQEFYINRTDNQDLFLTMARRGYATLTSYPQLQALQPQDGLPVVGLFAYSHIDYEIDRRRAQPPAQPSLSEMAGKALQMLEGRDKPFFLMIEAGKIDLAEHVHDAAAAYWELDQYMLTIQLAKDFAARRPNTIVIAVADHETGGLALGAQRVPPFDYPKPYLWLPSVLKRVNGSAEFMTGLIQGGQSIAEVMAQWAAIDDLTDAELASIQNAIDVGKTTFWISSAISDVVAARAKVGWSTPGHTGGDIALFTFGRKISSLHGNVQNAFVGQALLEELKLADQLAQVTHDLEQIYDPDTGTTTPASATPAAKRSHPSYWTHN